MANENVSNEVLLEMIKSIKEDTVEIKKTSEQQWKQINKNAQEIAGIKGASGIISAIVSILVAGIITLFSKRL
ncbi:MAG: hypothetical protein WDA59_00600 [Methanofastidiosum sp.]